MKEFNEDKLLEVKHGLKLKSPLPFGGTTLGLGEEAILIFYRPISSEEGD